MPYTQEASLIQYCANRYTFQSPPPERPGVKEIGLGDVGRGWQGLELAILYAQIILRFIFIVPNTAPSSFLYSIIQRFSCATCPATVHSFGIPKTGTTIL